MRNILLAAVAAAITVPGRANCDAERVIGSWFGFYGELRPHSALGGRTPGDVYRGALGEAA